jgi:hypothetical protein
MDRGSQHGPDVFLALHGQGERRETFSVRHAEPFALCCYAMRETRIGRVVFGVAAPLSGGVTRWNILADTKLSDTVPEVFAPPPQIVPGFMREQIESAITRRALLVWEVIRARNILAVPYQRRP